MGSTFQSILLRCRILVPTLILGACALSRPVFADIGDAYGFGGRNAALGNATLAWTFDAFSAYSNPAALSADDARQDPRRFRFGLGLIYMEPSFKPITGITTQNSFVSDAPRTGEVVDDYRPALGQALALSYRLLPDFFNLSAGAVVFLPIQQSAYIDSGEPFLPEYALYRSRLQRPQVEAGVGAELFSGLHFGIGVHTAYVLTSRADVFIQNSSNAGDANKTSTLRFSSSLKPKIVPSLSLLWIPPALEQRLSIAAAVRFIASSETIMNLRSAARVIGGSAGIDFVFKANSAIYYDPLTYQLAVSYAVKPQTRVFAQADYQLWSLYRSPAIQIQDPVNNPDCPAPGSCVGAPIQPSKYGNLGLKNIVIPKVALEHQAGIRTYRLGYGYRPSPFKLSDGAGNYLDPPKHMLTAGLGFMFQRFFGNQTPWSLDFHAAYHALVTQTVTKSPGNEIGNASESKIGAPGYEAGGRVFGGGLSVSVYF